MTSNHFDRFMLWAPVGSASAVPANKAWCILLMLLAAGCTQRADTPVPNSVAPATSGQTGSATISADPNPVPAGPDKFGKTKVSWDTGDGSIGEVYVSINGQTEKLFAGNRAKGSLEAPWVGNKGIYEFRLYAGKEHKTVLASVKVTREH